MEFKLDSKMMETLLSYSELLKKEPSTIIKEALENYFVEVEKELLEKSMEQDNALTSFSYEEFFDGLEFDDEDNKS
jgi:predicted DNA-binding protein